MEHVCTKCGWSTFNNKPGIPGERCPKCGGDLQHHWDEELDRDPPEPTGDPEDGLASRIRGRRRR